MKPTNTGEHNAAPQNNDENAPSQDGGDGVSRRGFLRGLGSSLAATALTGGLIAGRGEEAGAAAEQVVPQAPGAGGATVAGMVRVTLTVNGRRQSATVDVRRTLLDLLRNDLDLTGTKKVCDRGSCGACTVLVDGRPLYACMMLALDADGKRVETVESLAKGDDLHPLQEQFIKHDALQCGFCTPGFLMSSKALLDKNKRPTLDDVKNACAGNLCRCGTYPRIFDAVLDAAKEV